MVERTWMRERALEMDSHHECMGSWSLGLEFAFGSTEEEEDGDPDACFTWNSMPASAQFCPLHDNVAGSDDGSVSSLQTTL